MRSHRGDKKAGIESWGIPTRKGQEEENPAKERGKRQIGRRETKCVTQKLREKVFHEEKAWLCHLLLRYWVRWELKSIVGFGQMQALVTLTSHWWPGGESLIGMGGEEHMYPCDSKSSASLSLLHCRECPHVQNGVVENVMESKNLYLILWITQPGRTTP